MAYEHRIRVRYGEVDMQGVVFNAHWMAYMDDAMSVYFRELGLDWQAGTLGSVPFDVMLVKAALEWQGSAGFDDEVTIAVRPTRLGTSSLDLGFDIRRDGDPVLSAVVTYVSVVPGEKRSTPIPAEVRRLLEAEAA